LKVLVLGAGGQLGQHLVRHFPDCVGLSRQQLDLTRGDEVRIALESYRPQLVLNAAAYTAVDLAEDEREEAFSANAEGPGQLAAACQRQGIPMVYFSTDYVFPGQGRAAWSEKDDCGPVNFYGESKRVGEERTRQNCEQHFILRVSWLFGAHGNNFVRTILRLAAEREQLRIVSDQRGGPTWCGNLPEIVESLVRSQRWGTYHYCDGPAVSWWEFACGIVEEARRLGWRLKVREVLPIAAEDFPTRAIRPVCSTLDCSKLRALGILQNDWRLGLQHTLRQLKSTSG
jgi:dTDP-4-dehydrorhamnose reductase